MIIRKMIPSDIEDIEEIEKQCFSLPWCKKEIEKTFLGSNNLLCVAEDNRKVVGYVGMLMVLDEGNIINIAVESDKRNRGIAKGLLEYLIDSSIEEGIKSIILEVRKSNTIAIHLYESLGFTSVGIRKGFYERPIEDAIIMCRNNL